MVVCNTLWTDSPVRFSKEDFVVRSEILLLFWYVALEPGRHFGTVGWT